MPASLPRARLDLHCHSSASFDGEVPPERLMQLALEAGLTHLAITDHDTIEAALRARDEAPSGLTVIVGQEARTTEGDMIALFVERAIPSRLTPAQTSALIREQGGLVGLPHPFDVRRPSVGLGAVHHNELAHLAGLVDYVEVYNGRARDPQANARAAEFALAYGLARAAVSDAHRVDEVGRAATILPGPLTTARELGVALQAGGELMVDEVVADFRREGGLMHLIARLRGGE